MEFQHTQKFKKTTQHSIRRKEPPGEIHPTARQLKPKPRIGSTLMCRLVAHACPPGGFWADSQNFTKIAQFNREFHAVQFISIHYSNHESKRLKTTPLTSNPC